ncbi:MAG TPA: LacI family DNA-binding transcriptional regulator [Pseudonocardia sp.]|jgi:DNA-binding LacI/PurR family transcriptional regulator|uniref:LacI family DNA-binding transcriptional regulator n=1 Tax=Pseudonocardia sp. TaxID=60912 RepID=UPI002B4AC034|nr:LacI family DNA-binding transcriptional regulator [Pseudonocardia sp.]HLU58858.1 LacI family DNA-binding transcriptional regulator [Pseudonocardia sp.]
MSSRRVTIAEIAASAGVSVPTVSKVLNGRADVSAATRKRVQQIMADRGYQRRSSGPQRPVGLIDMAVPGLDSPWVVDVLRGAEAEAHKVGSQIVLTSTGRAPAGDPRWLDRLATRRSDGLVLVVNEAAPEAVAQLSALHTPVVLLDPVGGSDPSFATVGATNWAGGLSAVEHLVSLGHRRIAAISGRPKLMCSQERVEGYRAALGRAGIPVDERLVRFTEFCTEGGREGARAVLDLPDPPTAIFAGSDMQALGVYQEAAARGLRIPEDLSVVGFDDIAFAELASPPLTTVRQPLARMAAEAVRLLLDADDHMPGPPPRVELATHLVVRGSTGPAPGSA